MVLWTVFCVQNRLIKIRKSAESAMEHFGSFIPLPSGPQKSEAETCWSSFSVLPEISFLPMCEESDPADYSPNDKKCSRL